MRLATKELCASHRNAGLGGVSLFTMNEAEQKAMRSSLVGQIEKCATNLVLSPGFDKLKLVGHRDLLNPDARRYYAFHQTRTCID
jgi:hypothetical protein